MKVNELRVGNLCYYHIKDELNEPKEYEEVIVIDIEDLFLLSQYPDDSDYRPIPLTGEVLEKCGFKSKEIQNGETGDVGLYYFEKDEVCLSGNRPVAIWREEYIFYGEHIRYLHQLQNLYVALTGKELDVSKIEY